MEEIIITINNYKELKCVLKCIEGLYEEVRWGAGMKPTEFSFDAYRYIGETVCLIIDGDKRITWDVESNTLDDEDNEDLKGFARYTFDGFIETFVKKMGFEVSDDKFEKHSDSNIQLPVGDDSSDVLDDEHLKEFMNCALDNFVEAFVDNSKLYKETGFEAVDDK